MRNVWLRTILLAVALIPFNSSSHQEKWHEFTGECPSRCKGCQGKIKELLESISKVDITGVKGWPQKNALMAPLVGLALLSAGSTLSNGAWSGKIKECVEFVPPNIFKLMSGKLETDETWPLALSTIFLAEVYIKHPSDDLREKLNKLHELIEKAQSKSGGFQRTVGGQQGFSWGYGPDLVVATNVFALALAQLKRCKVDVKKEVIEKLLKSYENAINEDGSMRYGSGIHPKNKGYNKGDSYGRTPGSCLAMILLEATESDVYKKALAFADNNIQNENLFKGHSALFPNQLMLGWLCWRLQGKWWKRFQQDILSNRNFLKSMQTSYSKGTEDEVIALLLTIPLENLSFLKR